MYLYNCIQLEIWNHYSGIGFFDSTASTWPTNGVKIPEFFNFLSSGGCWSSDSGDFRRVGLNRKTAHKFNFDATRCQNLFNINKSWQIKPNYSSKYLTLILPPRGNTLISERIVTLAFAPEAAIRMREWRAEICDDDSCKGGRCVNLGDGYRC